MQIVTAWNGVAVGALAKASRVLANEPDQEPKKLFPVTGRPAQEYLHGEPWPFAKAKRSPSMTWHCFSHANDLQLSNSLASEHQTVSLVMTRYDSGMFGRV